MSTLGRLIAQHQLGLEQLFQGLKGLNLLGLKPLFLIRMLRIEVEQ